MMHRTLATFLFSFFVTAAWGDIQLDFDECVTKHGDEYVAARNRVVAAPSADDFLRGQSTSENWQKSIVAKILLEWRQHQQRYQSLVGSTNLVKTRSGETNLVWAHRAENLDPDVLALAYEFLLKGSEGDAGRIAAIEIIPFIEGELSKPSKFSTHLDDALNDASVTDEVKQNIARVIGRLPTSVFSARQTIEAAIAAIKADNKELSSILTNSIKFKCEGFSVTVKNDLADLLRKDAGLTDDQTGPIILQIGCTVLEESAVDLKREADRLISEGDEEEQRAGLTALARIGSGDAIQSLLKFASDQEKSTLQRSVAIDRLATLKFSPKLSRGLSDILKDDRTPRLVRQQALRTLVRIGMRQEPSRGEIIDLLNNLEMDDQGISQRIDKSIAAIQSIQSAPR